MGVVQFVQLEGVSTSFKATFIKVGMRTWGGVYRASRPRGLSSTPGAKNSAAVASYAHESLQTNHALLSALCNDDYSRKLHGFFDASLGSHFRHVLDHFACCVGYEGAPHVMDYDKRTRGTLIETDRGAALELNIQLLSAISTASSTQHNNFDSPVFVRFMHSAQDGATFDCPSTYGRELAFAAHHATHHHALIKLMMCEMGYDTSRLLGVGVAVSTQNSTNSKEQ